jgi:lipoate-protein ligase A
MKYLELTYANAAQNLACDEALLEFFEQSGSGEELLRLWQSDKYFVVLGHGNKWREEVDGSACAAKGIPVLRRCSGGGTVLQGPGCLNYSLILSQHNFSGASVGAAFEFVLERHRVCLEPLIGNPVSIRGISDLTLGARKFSGNAQYRKRQYVLVHGTFLLDFDLRLMEKFLKVPTKQPDYRRQRAHYDFLVNLQVRVEMIRESLRTCWSATDVFDPISLETNIHRLLRKRYQCADWNEKF